MKECEEVEEEEVVEEEGGVIMRGNGCPSAGQTQSQPPTRLQRIVLPPVDVPLQTSEVFQQSALQQTSRTLDSI